jgi:hypothetical protein
MSMHLRYLRSARTALALVALALLSAPAPATMPQGAASHPPYLGIVPLKSAVVFSTRFTRPDALPVIRAFGATRVEWSYNKDPEFAAALRELAPWVGGAISGMPPSPVTDGFARDLDGKVVSAPWAKSFDGRWLTTTHPETQADYRARVTKLVELGVDSIQHDDPLLQVYAALYQGGDFNDSTVQGFPQWLATRASPAQVAAAGLAGFTGDYRQWLKDKQGIKDADDYRARWRKLPSSTLWLDYVRSTVLDHMLRVRQLASQLRGKPVPLSMNLSVLYEPLASNPYFFLVPAVDYVMPETHIDDFAQMTSQAATARSLGLGFVPSLRPGTRAENRVAIATLYALGGQPIVPWDVYAGNDERGKVKRFFGTADDYSDLYRFVKAQAPLFDGMETAALVGLMVPVERGPASAVKALVTRLVLRGIPFRFVPVGRNGPATYRADFDRLKALALVVTTNPDADYPQADLKALSASGVRRIRADQLRDEDLDALRPFVAAPGSDQLRLIARGDPADPLRLLLHVIDAARGDALQADPACRRRIGIRRSQLGGSGIVSMTWRSNVTPTELHDVDDRSDLYLTLDGCPVWGVLDIRLKP